MKKSWKARAVVAGVFGAVLAALPLPLDAGRSAPERGPLVASINVIVTNAGTTAIAGLRPSGVQLATTGETIQGEVRSVECGGCSLEAYVGGSVFAMHSSRVWLNVDTGAFEGEGTDAFTITRSGLPDLSGVDVTRLDGMFNLGGPELGDEVPLFSVNRGTWSISGLGGGTLTAYLARTEVAPGVSTLAGRITLRGPPTVRLQRSRAARPRPLGPSASLVRGVDA